MSLIKINVFDCCRRRRHRLHFTIGPVTKMAKLTTKKLGDATFVLADDQKVSCSVTLVDDVGNPVAPATGTIVWAVSDPTILALTTNTDGTCSVASTAKLGSCQMSVTVTDPNNPTAPPLTGSLTVTVSASAATGINIVPGTPEHV